MYPSLRFNPASFISAVEPTNDPWGTPSSQQQSPWGTPSASGAQSGGMDPFLSSTTNGTTSAVGNNIDDAFDVLSARMSPAKTLETTGQSLLMFDPLAGTWLNAHAVCAMTCVCA